MFPEEFLVNSVLIKTISRDSLRNLRLGVGEHPKACIVIGLCRIFSLSWWRYLCDHPSLDQAPINFCYHFEKHSSLPYSVKHCLL